jgi:hypothetical protein
MRFAEIAVAPQKPLNQSRTQCLKDAQQEHPDTQTRRRRRPRPRPFNEPKPMSLS